jgi:Tol biopolymer transport system component
MGNSRTSTIRSIDGDGTRDAEFATQYDPFFISANASGSKIVYVAHDTIVDKFNEPDTPRHVYALNTITKQSLLLSPSDTKVIYSTCSWNGTRILFDEGTPTNSDLFEMNLRDGTMQNITLSCPAWPVCSPDDLHFAYYSSACSFAILDRQTGIEQTIKIPSDHFTNPSPVYNPSGTLIAVCIDGPLPDDPANTCIYLYDVQSHRITPEYHQLGHTIHQVVFSPDGKYLLFDERDQSNKGAIWSLRLSDKALHCIYALNTNSGSGIDGNLFLTCSL